MASPISSQAELARTLRELRDAGGLSLRAAADAADVSYSTVRRIERGEYQPTVELVQKLATGLGAKPAVRRRLAELAGQLADHTEPRQVLLRGGMLAQRRYRELEASAGLVRAFSLAVVPGMLQTEAYMRAVFASGGYSAEEVDGQVAQRLARRDRALSSAGATEYVQVMTEGVLRWQLVGPEAMAEQLDLIAELARGDNRVRVGVIPWSRPTAGVLPMHGFDLYDERGAVYGALNGVSYVTAPRAVADFVRMFEQVEALADFDGKAAEHAERIQGDHHRSSG